VRHIAQRHAIAIHGAILKAHTARGYSINDGERVGAFDEQEALCMSLNTRSSL
jgi:hypothetical protein